MYFYNNNKNWVCLYLPFAISTKAFPGQSGAPFITTCAVANASVVIPSLEWIKSHCFQLSCVITDGSDVTPKILMPPSARLPRRMTVSPFQFMVTPVGTFTCALAMLVVATTLLDVQKLLLN